MKGWLQLKQLPPSVGLNDQFVSVVALSAPFNRRSLMVRYVYIRSVHNIGKNLVILLRGRAG